MINAEVFISHASEDKEELVRPLAQKLRKSRVQVWYDEYSLLPGDSLRESIDLGLNRADYGLVVFSENFFKKKWPINELEGLFSKEIAGGENRIIPIWHKINFQRMTSLSPILAGRVAIDSSIGVKKISKTVCKSIKSMDQRRKIKDIRFDSPAGGYISMRARPNSSDLYSSERIKKLLTEEKIEDLSKEFQDVAKKLFDEWE